MPAKHKLQIKSLRIKEMPGLPNGLNPYIDIDFDFVLIYGKNASGKSSTARAIKYLLWNKQQADSYISSSFKVMHDNYRLTMRYGQRILNKNGQQIQEKLPVSPHSQHYFLNMKDMLVDNEDELAQKILNEIYGGINIPEIIRNQEYSNKIYSKSRQEYKAYQNASTSYNEVAKTQKELKEKQAQLDKILEEKESLEKQSNLSSILEKSISIKRQEKIVEQLHNALDKYNDLYPKLLDFPLNAIHEWQSERNNTQENISRKKIQLAEAIDDYSQLKFTTENIRQHSLQQLKELTETLTKADINRSTAKTSLDNRKTKLLQLSYQLGLEKGEKLEEWPAYTELSNFKLPDTDELANLVEKYEQNRIALSKLTAEIQVLQSQIDSIKNETDEIDTISTETLTMALSSLSAWLKEHRSKQKLNFLQYLLAISLAVLVSFLSYYALKNTDFSWIYLLAIVLIIAMLAFFIIIQFNPDGSTRKQDYKASNLPEPDPWNINTVNSKIDKLIHVKTAKTSYKDISDRLHILKQRESELQENLKHLESTINNHKSNIAHILHLDNQDVYTQLIHKYIGKIAEWQELHTSYKEKQTSYQQVELAFKSKLEEFNNCLPDSVSEKCNSIESVNAMNQVIQSDYSKSKEINASKNSLRAQIKESTGKVAKLQEKINEKFKSLNKTENDQEYIQKLYDNIDAFKDAKDNLNEAQGKLNVLQEQYNEMHSKGQYENYLSESYSIEQLITMLQKSQNASQALQEKNEQITSIKTNISNAKSGNSLAKALKTKEEAAQELADLYHINLSKNIGYTILNMLKSQFNKENQPVLLSRSNEILAQISDGKYQIDILSQGNNPQFQAIDTQRGIKLSLSELSSGTRIHFLLALRLASIEEQEDSGRFWSMPLLADELLANSDEERSEAIIKILLDFSRRKRQIFYFTAQEDELQKWLEHLRKQNDLKYKVLNLSSSSPNMDYDDTSMINPDINALSLVKNIPDWVDNKADYQTILNKKYHGIPHYNVLRTEATEVHLWYYVDDMEILYKLLKNGVETWGQLKTLQKTNKTYQKYIEKEKIDEKADIYRQFRSLYQKGRPKAINRKILRENEVTDSKLDDVTELLRECNYNPVTLLENILEIDGIGSVRKDKIQDSLTANGYLPSSDPLTDESIERQLLSFIQSKNISPKEAEQFLAQFTEKSDIQFSNE